ncbi:MAG: trehalose-phosphatase [Dehalococcoidales bacterium]|nr:trehalose-phosphatase [Dehalococcoidales bacterium]
MPRILDNLTVLKKLIRRKPFGLITDMDGTISPVPLDFQKRMPLANVRQLGMLVPRMALVAIISGREAEAIKEMVNTEGIKYIGHYGMECWENNQAILHPDARAYLPSIRAVAKELEPLRSIEGMIIQDKWATISIHYHLTPQPDVAKERIMELLKKSRHLKNLRIMEEKTDIGIVPPVNIDKGTAVTNLINQYHLKGAIFLGDDTADVPAFHAIRLASQNMDFEGLAILVTGEETRQDIIGEVDFTLDGVRETELLLEWLTNELPSKY